MSVLRDRATLVWIGLVVATCVTTWLLSEDAISSRVAVVGTFALAGLKVRYVMLDFMELRDAPRGPRLALQLWIVAVVVLILGFWFASPPY